MLTKVAWDMAKGDKIPGMVSFATGLITYLATQDLVYTITISVVLSSIVAFFTSRDEDTITNDLSKPFTIHLITKVTSFLVNIYKVNSITTTDEQLLCLDGKDAALLKGKKIAIVDDVISTGESIRALEELVEKAGAIVEAKAAILAEGDAADRDDFIYLGKLPLFKK
ncbi:phosphoribosyltransferase family protein [Gracilibacillus saliphilus]|uniref:phosphoribosyltransferase family protein n=1 Tax=Gracilibacillus saliphilus TaxID=543890 RepID=UPI001EE35AC6|nr:phosphoribosyltransferase family protein [Gracilibacillus saliphilus]